MSGDDVYSELKRFGVDPLKAAVASVSELYRLPQQALDSIKASLIIEAFKFHYKNNEFYRKACECQGIGEYSIHSFEDLIRIPLVPIAKFKSASSHELLSKPLSQIEHEMRSTGTSGIPSIARRCHDTVDVAVVAIYAMYREFLGLSKGAGLYIVSDP